MFLFKKKRKEKKEEALIKKKKFCSVDRISESYLVARFKHLENVFAEVVIPEAGREVMKRRSEVSCRFILASRWFLTKRRGAGVLHLLQALARLRRLDQGCG